jgi:hypothetical protein
MTLADLSIKSLAIFNDTTMTITLAYSSSEGLIFE